MLFPRITHKCSWDTPSFLLTLHLLPKQLYLVTFVTWAQGSSLIPPLIIWGSLSLESPTTKELSHPHHNPYLLSCTKQVSRSHVTCPKSSHSPWLSEKIELLWNPTELPSPPYHLCKVNWQKGPCLQGGKSVPIWNELGVLCRVSGNVQNVFI